MELSKGWEMQGYYPNSQSDPDPDSDWLWAIVNFVVFIPTTHFFIHRTGIVLINLDIIYLDLEQE